MIDVARARDACILLAGQRPYREYPSSYVLTHMQRAGFRIDSITSIASHYTKDFVLRQIGATKGIFLRERLCAVCFLSHCYSLCSAVLDSSSTHTAVGESKLPLFADPSLRAAMADYLRTLRMRTAALRWPFEFGSDYVIAATPVRNASEPASTAAISRARTDSADA